MIKVVTPDTNRLFSNNISDLKYIIRILEDNATNTKRESVPDSPKWNFGDNLEGLAKLASNKLYNYPLSIGLDTLQKYDGIVLLDGKLEVNF